MLRRKYAIIRYYIFPPDLTSASVLQAEKRKPGNCIYSLKWCILFSQHTKYVKNITWSQLNHPSVSKRSTVCIRQDLERENSILQYVKLTLMFMKCVTVSVTVSKWGLFTIKPDRKSICLNKCRTLLNALLMTICLSPTQCILHSTQSNCCTVKLSTSFLPSYGP